MSLSKEEINELKCLLPQRKRLYSIRQLILFASMYLCETGFRNYEATRREQTNRINDSVSSKT
jgi:hypothetical protein